MTTLFQVLQINNVQNDNTLVFAILSLSDMVSSHYEDSMLDKNNKEKELLLFL